MKKLLYILAFIPILGLGQSQDKNYIKTIAYKKPTSQGSVDVSSPSDAAIQINYVDGLGRPIQRIAYKQSGTGNDIVMHTEYDPLGRQSKDFLPYVKSTSLDFDTDSQTNQANFYSSNLNPNFETTNYPYSEKKYDDSPLNRILKQAAPGENWKIDSGHEIKFEYDVNTSQDQVFRFKITKNGINYSLESLGYYSPNLLYKNTIKNENWTSGKDNTTEEFKDDLGNVILKRAYNNGQKHDTYYVYDAIGNLIYVIPPLASDNVAVVQSQTTQVPFSYYKFIDYKDFLKPCNNNGTTLSGGGGLYVKINTSSENPNNVPITTFQCYFSCGFNLATIDVTKSFPLNLPASIPNGDLITYISYTLYIENNVLKFRNNSTTQPCFTTLNSSFAQSLDSNLFGSTTTTTTSNVVHFSEIENLGYQYKYDNKNRLVEKKLPGKQWEFIIYDKLDRPVATGPAFTPYGGTAVGWLITQYDVFGRVIQTGWKQQSVSTSDRATHQNAINTGGTPFVLTANEILTKTYYDNYNFTGAPSPLPTVIEGQSIATNVKGLITGSWTRILDTPNSNSAEINYIFYDDRYRPVSSYSSNYLGGYTQVDNKLDWAGKTLYTITKHRFSTNAAVLTVKDIFEYTPQDRMKLHTRQINSGNDQLITKNDYDELGKLIGKNVGGPNTTGAVGLQTVDYSYNIRGWLKGINDVNNIGNDLFSFKINYNTPEEATALHNGNISETYWKTASDNKLRKYNYAYDNLDRLLDASYKRVNETTAANAYRETLSYDKNGNIQTLSRFGLLDEANYAVPIDDLVYTYDAEKKNRLKKVVDNTPSQQGFKDGANAGDDYDYDANGNMILDNNKGITNIQYNHLNLPTKIVFGSNTITYLYNATGQKLSKTVTENSIITKTDYLAGGFQYKNSELQLFPHAEGYVKVGRMGKGFNYSYVFNYTDHLGNVRVSYSDIDGNGILGDEHVQECFTQIGRDGIPYTFCNDYFTSPILEENHYYPFGLKHEGYNMNNAQVDYKYKFNHREWQSELGLNVTAMDFRQYDPALGRFYTMDVMTDIMPSLSPYRFAFNNPVLWNDPSGRLEGTDPETDPTIILKEVVVTGKAKNAQPASFNYSLIDWSNVDNSRRPTLEQYNKHNGTSYRSFDEYYNFEHYQPALRKQTKAMHGATDQVAKVCVAVTVGLVASVVLAPVVIAAAPTIQSFAASTLTNPIVQDKLLDVGANFGSQLWVNKGDKGEVNILEAGLSAANGPSAVVFGETFSVKTNDIANGNYITVSSVAQTSVQVSGGLGSYAFSQATDNYLAGTGWKGKVVGLYFKFLVESASNAAPNLVPDEK